MSFQLQFGNLVAELRKAGINPDSAVRIARILGNSLQTTRRGPATTDTTPRNMRQVSSSTRQYQLTNLDFKEGDPDHRQTRLQTTEERLQPTQASSLQTEQSPQETSSPFNVAGGTYIDATSEGDGVGLNLRVAGTGPFLTQNSESNTLVGVGLRAEAECGQEGLIRFFIEPRGEENIFKLQFSIDTLKALVEETIKETLGLDPNPNDPNNPQIPTQNSPFDDFLVDATLNQNGLCFKKYNGQQICFPVESCEP